MSVSNLSDTLSVRIEQTKRILAGIGLYVKNNNDASRFLFNLFVAAYYLTPI